MSTLVVDTLKNVAGGTPMTVPPAQGDSSARIATTGWVNSSLSSALATFTAQNSSSTTTGSVVNSWTFTPETGTVPTSLTKGLRYRVKFHRSGQFPSAPLPLAENSAFLYSPDSVINSTTWLCDTNVTAGGAVEGPRAGKLSRSYTANGNTANSRVYSSNFNLAANSSYLVSVKARFVSGTFPSNGSLVDVKYNNGSGSVSSVIPITQVPTDGSWVELSMLVSNVNSLTTNAELLRGLNANCVFAIEDFRRVKLGTGPQLQISNLGFRPLTYRDATTGDKLYYAPSAGELIDVEFDGTDWVLLNSQVASGSIGNVRVLTGASFDAQTSTLSLNDIGKTILVQSSAAANAAFLPVHLPTCSSLSLPGELYIFNASACPVTIGNGAQSTSSGDTFFFEGCGPSTTIRQFVLAPYSGVAVTLIPPKTPGGAGTVFFKGNSVVPHSGVNQNAGWAKSIWGSGYQVLPSGLILQWGGIGSPGGTYSFPIAFPTFALQVFVTNTTSQGQFVDNAYGYAVSASSFYAATKASNQSIDSGYPIAWFAIGY